MKKFWIGLVIVLVLIAIGAYLWLQQAPQPLPPPTPVVTPPPVAPPPPPPPMPPKPAIEHPVQLPPGMTTVPPLEQAEDFVKKRLTDLLGAKTVDTKILLEKFIFRVVATVDNLGRSLAPPSRWPIHATPGRFSVVKGKDGTVISAKNYARYTPFVKLVESVDSERAVALYRQLYPLFQKAYEELGYSGKYFNDRLVVVIDLLLDTPEPAGAVKVELPEFPGPLKPTHPWVLYRFTDPDLEGLTSGQKILVRVGVKNEKALKAKLAEIRKLIVAQKPSQ